MKKELTELTPYELYINIFKPLFGLNFEYPKSWNEEELINGKFKPEPYFFKDEVEIEEKIKEIENKFRNGDNRAIYSLDRDVRLNIENAKNKILEDNNLYEYLEIPIFNISTCDEYISVGLDHMDNSRVLFNKLENFKTEHHKHVLMFYKNGDIKISNHKTYEYRTSLLNKDTVSYCDNSMRYLSYSETIDMRIYFNDKNIDINFLFQ